MGTEIDRLEVQVEAQATKANNQLDKLVGKLDALSSSLSHLNSSGLTGLANGVSKFAQASSQLSNVKTTDFTRLTKNIDKIENLNTQQIYSASSAIVTLSNAVNSLGSVSANSMQVVNVANSIGKLGGASVQKAITNLPALATAMNDLMTTLSKAPAVSNNIIQMTRALADLASQGAKVGTAGTSLTKSVNGVGTAMSATTKKARSLSSALGSIYQKYFLLMRGASKLWDSIEGSMDYVEVLNYFDAAMQQVSANAGESSAEAYFESFSSRAKELTSKMTGFNVNDNGTLTATGNASLGINPTKLMNYQATFAQMSSSMGVASETSLLLSQALTEIGADLASVKNMDFDKVWKDMASGLAGMSRTLDKYGVNIRNVNLQQKLLDLGIEENITNLNQNDKALLRAIILLDSTKYAWGDLADTLEQPANQLRLLESNFANLSRTLGNLFLPVVSNVLPYVNGLVIGLQRLFTWVGNLLGIDLSGITSAVSDSAVDIGELLGETDDLTDSLTAAGNAAKKLKSNLQAFDELNVITTQTDSSSALSGVGLPSGLLDTAFEKSFSEYQKAWDEAFSNMENRANEFADKVEEYLQPVRDIIEDFAIGDYFKAGQDTSNLVAGIFNFFSNAIDKVDWYEIGENIGDYLAGVNWIKVLGSVGHLIWEALKAALEIGAGVLSTAHIDTAIISMIAMPKLLKTITASKYATGISKLAGKFKILSKNISGYLQNLDATGQVLTFNTGVEAIRNNLTGLQKGVITAVAAFAEFEIVSHTFEGLVDGSENLIAGIAKIGGAAGVAALAMYTALGPAGLAIAGVTGLIAGIIGIEEAMQKINAETIGNTIKDALTTPGGMSMEEISGTFCKKMESIASSFDNVSAHSQELETAQINIKNTYGEITAIQSAMEQGVLSVEDGVKKMNTAFDSMPTEFANAVTALEQGIIGALGEGSILRQYLEAMGYDVEALNGIVVGDFASIQNEFDKLVEEYENIKESTNPDDITRKEEIIKSMTQISGVFDETIQSITAFETSMNNMHLNMGSVIDTKNIGDLKFKTEEFGNNLQKMVDSYYSANNSIAKGNEEFQNNLATFNSMLKAAGIEENTAIYNEIMSKIPDATNASKIDLQDAFEGIINTIQEDALGAIPALIEQAGTEWDNLDFDTRTELNYQGITNKDAYIASVVKSYENDILSPMEEQINNALAGLDIDSEGIMVQKAKELYDSLFYYDYKWDLGGGERTFRMRENWEAILSELDIPGITEGYGENIVSGLNKGVSDNEKQTEETMRNYAKNSVEEPFKDETGINSPSKVFADYGMYSVIGFNNGIYANKSKTVDAISSYAFAIKESFSNVPTVLSEIGENAMAGLLNGMSSMESDIYDKADSIADNIAKTIQTALDIHSPSRVMYALGEFTMQGFQLGMENLYGNIQKSIEKFGGTLQYEIAPAPEPVYAGCQAGFNFKTPEYNNYSYYENQNNYDTAETNMLLRELLVATREGKIIEVEGREIGRTAVKYIQGEEERLQKNIVGIH